MANTRSLIECDRIARRDRAPSRPPARQRPRRLQEWRLQRLTAIALIPLGLYFAASMLWLAKSDQITAAALARLAGAGVA